jgi:hypothetical protein
MLRERCKTNRAETADLQVLQSVGCRNGVRSRGQGHSIPYFAVFKIVSMPSSSPRKSRLDCPAREWAQVLTSGRQGSQAQQSLSIG